MTSRNKTSAVAKILVAGLALGLLIGTTGCDETAAMNLVSWGGMADPLSTSSMGLPMYSPAYWGQFGIGTQNVDSWGGLANAWNTSSLGLPAGPW